MFRVCSVGTYARLNEPTVIKGDEVPPSALRHSDRKRAADSARTWERRPDGGVGHREVTVQETFECCLYARSQLRTKAM